MPDRYRSPARFKIAMTALAVVLGACLGTFTLLVLDRRPPRENIEFTLRKEAYRPGDLFSGQWRMTYLRLCDGRAVRWATTDVDPNVVVYLNSEDIRAFVSPPKVIPAIVTVGIAAFAVPHLPPGRAYYHLRIEFGCNWVQKNIPAFALVVDYPVVPFEVLPPEKVSWADTKRSS